MAITLNKATISDCQELYDLQIKSFKALLDKYQDYHFNPGAEQIIKTVHRLHETNTEYYFICLDNENIGAVRIVRYDTLCKLKQIYILPQHQSKGYAQKAIELVEGLYPHALRWELDTIKQEGKLCYLYEKMGYVKTGKEQNIKEGMDIVFFAK